MAEAPTRTVTVDLTQADIDILDDISSRHGISMTQALHRALVQAKFIEDAEAAGKKVILEESDRSLKQVKFK